MQVWCPLSGKVNRATYIQEDSEESESEVEGFVLLQLRVGHRGDILKQM